MASVNKSAAAKRAAAEVAGAPVKIKFLGTTFTGPPTLPATFSFDALAAASGEDEGALFRIIQGVLDEQLPQVRDLMAEQDTEDGGAELLGELFGAITDAYGISEGE